MAFKLIIDRVQQPGYYKNMNKAFQNVAAIIVKQDDKQRHVQINNQDVRGEGWDE